jgi:peptidoglycan L-alanyl-D-glutamate endopeptidase CwlK
MKHVARLIGIHSTLKEFAHKLDEVFPIIVIFGYRSVEEQDWLYAQGRTRPGNKVTNARGGSSAHNFGLAVDLAPDPLNWNNIKRFDEMVDAAKKIIAENNYPITCGADFKSIVDRPHFEITGWKQIRDDLQKAKENPDPDPDKVKY